MAISQISWEVLLRFAKVAISHRRYCVFQTPVLEALWKLRILKMQYLPDEMLDCLWICNTSHTFWAILTCQALLRGPFPRQKWRYCLRGVAKIEILQLPLPDAFRHQSEVSGASLEKHVKHLDSFSDAPKRAPRAVWGLFFGPPTSSPFFEKVLKRTGAFSFSNINNHMDWSLLLFWILKFRASKTLQRRLQVA